LLLGQVQTPLSQEAPPQQSPPSPLPQTPPISWHVGQHSVPLAQPELSIDPSGSVVRQKVAPLVVAASLAPVKSTSTRQAPLRSAPERSASTTIASVRFVLLRLQFTQPSLSAEEPSKSHPTKLALGAGTQGEPG
jgi:hypothetical protein